MGRTFQHTAVDRHIWMVTVRIEQPDLKQDRQQPFQRDIDGTFGDQALVHTLFQQLI